jgi:GAF domain-containing protein
VGDDVLTGLAVDREHLRLLQELGISSAMIVPLTGRRGRLGAITLIRAASDIVYADDDVALAEDLGHRAALAIETARSQARTPGASDVPASRTADEDSSPAV